MPWRGHSPAVVVSVHVPDFFLPSQFYRARMEPPTRRLRSQADACAQGRRASLTESPQHATKRAADSDADSPRSASAPARRRLRHRRHWSTPPPGGQQAAVPAPQPWLYDLFPAPSHGQHDVQQEQGQQRQEQEEQQPDTSGDEAAAAALHHTFHCEREAIEAADAAMAAEYQGMLDTQQLLECCICAAYS